MSHWRKPRPIRRQPLWPFAWSGDVILLAITIICVVFAWQSFNQIAAGLHGQ